LGGGGVPRAKIIIIIIRCGPKPADALLAALGVVRRLGNRATELCLSGSGSIAKAKAGDEEAGRALALYDSASLRSGRGRGAFVAVAPAGAPTWLGRLGSRLASRSSSAANGNGNGNHASRPANGNGNGHHAHPPDDRDTDKDAGAAAAAALQLYGGRVRNAQTGGAWIEGASLFLPVGGSAAVVGPSGCGKSTLLRCMALLEPLSAGSLLAGGQVCGCVL